MTVAAAPHIEGMLLDSVRDMLPSFEFVDVEPEAPDGRRAHRHHHHRHRHHHHHRGHGSRNHSLSRDPMSLSDSALPAPETLDRRKGDTPGAADDDDDAAESAASHHHHHHHGHDHSHHHSHHHGHSHSHAPHGHHHGKQGQAGTRDPSPAAADGEEAHGHHAHHSSHGHAGHKHEDRHDAQDAPQTHHSHAHHAHHGHHGGHHGGHGAHHGKGGHSPRSGTGASPSSSRGGSAAGTEDASSESCGSVGESTHSTAASSSSTRSGSTSTSRGSSAVRRKRAAPYQTMSASCLLASTLSFSTGALDQVRVPQKAILRCRLGDVDPLEYVAPLLHDNAARMRLGQVVAATLAYVAASQADGPCPCTLFDTPRHAVFLAGDQVANRIARVVPMSAEALCLALLYLDEILVRRLVDVTPNNLGRIFSLAFLAASKFCYDSVYSNRFYAKVFGMDIDTLNGLEVAFLSLFGFNITPNPEKFCLYTAILMSFSFYISSDSRILVRLATPVVVRRPTPPAQSTPRSLSPSAYVSGAGEEYAPVTSPATASTPSLEWGSSPVSCSHR